jgi:hypothetical protein
MIVLEMKALVKPSQCTAIDEAIRTVQFIRNKALRLWMDSQREDKIDKYALNKYCKYCAILAKEFKFVNALNSTARQVGLCEQKEIEMIFNLLQEESRMIISLIKKLEN